MCNVIYTYMYWVCVFRGWVGVGEVGGMRVCCVGGWVLCVYAMLHGSRPLISSIPHPPLTITPSPHDGVLQEAAEELFCRLFELHAHDRDLQAAACQVYEMDGRTDGVLFYLFFPAFIRDACLCVLCVRGWAGPGWGWREGRTHNTPTRHH